MDPNGRIYMDDEDKIPAEDKARLEGYLRAKSEDVDLQNMAYMKARRAEAALREYQEMDRQAEEEDDDA